MPVAWRGAHAGQIGGRKRKAAPPKPQAEAQVEFVMKLGAGEHLEGNLLITGSRWGSERELGNLIAIFREREGLLVGCFSFTRTLSPSKKA